MVMRVRFFPGVLTVALLATVWLPCAAQSSGQGMPPVPYKAKAIAPKRIPVPFVPDFEAEESSHSIELLPADQMTEQDRDVEADAEASIAEHAGMNGLEFNEGAWSYQQIVCPALPNHMFLRFTRNNGDRDVSLFSASIPRNGEGRVRIIPILRRSYSLFSPAPINALTIAAFNHIRTEEGPGPARGWLGIGLCYAALAGANPQLEAQGDLSGKQKFYPQSLATLYLMPTGGATIQFNDATARPRPIQWELIFNSKGRLMKVTHTPAPVLTVMEVPRITAYQPGTPTAATAAESQPAAAEPVTAPPQ
jgi:hypothetical protein